MSLTSSQDIARFRPDLRLLISSATLNAQKFADFFDQAPIFDGAYLFFFLYDEVLLVITDVFFWGSARASFPRRYVLHSTTRSELHARRCHHHPTDPYNPAQR